MKEQWKDIEGYEGLYQVSDFARIKRLTNNKAKKEKILKQSKNAKGYMKIDLWKNAKRKTFLVHILVAKLFIPNPNNLLELNHKDENPLNPKADNLEWCTREYNINYGNRNQKVSNAHNIKVYQYTLEKKFIKEWKSAKEAAMKNNCDRSSITKCCKEKIKYTKGYIWSYIKQIEVV